MVTGVHGHAHANEKPRADLYRKLDGRRCRAHSQLVHQVVGNAVVVRIESDVVSMFTRRGTIAEIERLGGKRIQRRLIDRRDCDAREPSRLRTAAD